MDVRADKNLKAMAERAAKWRVSRRPVMIIAPIAVVLLAAAAFGILVMTAKKPEKVTEAALPIAVEIAVARAAPTTLRVATQGEVKPKTEAEVAARVPGQIVYLAPRLEPGAAFRKGETLARIDPSDYRLALDRSRSQVSRARENFARAQSEADLAEQDWRELGLEGDPSDLTLQRPQVAAATADLRTAEAQVREAQVNLQRAEVTAPFDGRVKERRADLGDFVTAGMPIASLFSVDLAQIRVSLTDADLGVLGVGPGYAATADKPGPRARVAATIGGVEQVWDGVLTMVEANIDPTTRLVYGLVEVDEPFSEAAASPLAPGTFATVELAGRQEEILVGFPRAAFKKNEYVYVVAADDTISTRRVTQAMATADEVFVRAGLKDGERVVVSYVPSPRDGMKVRDLDAPAPAPKPAPEAAKTARKRE